MTPPNATAPTATITTINAVVMTMIGSRRAWRDKEINFPAPNRRGRPRSVLLLDLHAEEQS
jgi:hypothetical protein